MRTILELYCEFAGWQGGTIHQAIDDYTKRPIEEKDKFCNKVFNFGLSNISDIHTFQTFTKARF